MTRGEFQAWLGTVSGIFARKAPSHDIGEMIFGRVSRYPDEFFLWAVERFHELDNWPSNFGKYLTSLWYQWRGQNPQMVAREQRGCPDCTGGYHDDAGKGFYAWREDEDGCGCIQFANCRCWDSPDMRARGAWTKQLAMSRGWKMIPQQYDYPGGLEDFAYRLEHGHDRPAVDSAKLEKYLTRSGLARQARQLEYRDSRKPQGFDSTEYDPSRFRHLSATEQADYFQGGL